MIEIGPEQGRTRTGLAGLLFTTVIGAALGAAVTLAAVGLTCFPDGDAVGTRLVSTGAVATAVICAVSAGGALLRAVLQQRR